MLKNFWYACEMSSRVQTRPCGVRLMGRDLVLYRDGSGVVHALDGRCVHRGGALADGRVEGRCIRCPYHGWRYGPEGICVEVPSQPPDVPIPVRARVEALPVSERYGWIWVFVGGRAEAERSSLPDLAEVEDPDWHSIQGDFHWQAHVGRVVENGLDIAHAAFVHGASFGNPGHPEVAPLEVQEEEWGASVATGMTPRRRRGLSRLLGRGRGSVEVRLGFRLPSMTRLELRLDRFTVILLTANVPVDETRTRSLYIQARNLMTSSWADANAKRRIRRIFEEDRPIVEAVRPTRMPASPRDEVSVRADRLGIAYRRRVQSLIEQGWGIDSTWV